MKKIVLILGLFLLVLGCTSNQGNVETDKGVDVDMSKIVESGDTIKVHYTGKLEDGSVFDSSEGRDPLEFKAGAGQMIKGFDNGVIGLKLDEEKDLVIAPKDGYGETDSSLIVGVPLSQFEDQGIVPEIGTELVLNGQRGKIVEVDNQTVKVDFNHFLAGKTLIFSVKIVEITKG